MTAATGSTAAPVTRGRSRRPEPHLRGDIEGLRAVAVLMVLLYHAGVPGLRGGFAGVDVFFVISGYLITGLLVAEARDHGSVSLPRFYARRARRLLPAASLVLIVTSVAGWALLPAGRRAELGSDVLGATFYVVNWVLAGREVDYLAEDSAPSLLQHYWSLSVEEQFYVAWPVLILIVLWVCRRRRLPLTGMLTLALTLVVIASFVWSVLRTSDSPGTAYFDTTTRVWQLGVGGLLVLLTPWLVQLRRPRAAALAWLGLLLVGATLLFVSSATPWPGSTAALPTLGTAAVIAAGIAWPHSPPARLLGTPPMRFLGGLSYGLYLWHWPALRLLEELRPGSGLKARLTVAAACILLAWITLHLVENPVRRHRRLSASVPTSLAAGASLMAVSALAGLLVLASAPRLEVGLDDPSDGASGSRPSSGWGALDLVDPASQTDPQLRPVSDLSRPLAVRDDLRPDPATATEDISVAYAAGCMVSMDSTEIVGDRDGCVFGDPQGQTEVALVGDSKMEQWSSALDAIGRVEGWRVVVYTRSACRFTTQEDGECVDYNHAVVDRLLDPDDRPDILVLSYGASGADAAEAEAEGSAELLQPLVDAGTQVVVLGDTTYPRPVSDSDQPSFECLDQHRDDYAPCRYVPSDTPGSVGTPTLRSAAGLLEVPFIALDPWICPEARADVCPPVVGGVVLYRQGSHLTETYVRTLTPVLHHSLSSAGVAHTPLSQIVWEPPAARIG